MKKKASKEDFVRFGGDEKKGKVIFFKRDALLSKKYFSLKRKDGPICNEKYALYSKMFFSF